jgi:hypothetical protein
MPIRQKSIIGINSALRNESTKISGRNLKTFEAGSMNMMRSRSNPYVTCMRPVRSRHTRKTTILGLLLIFAAGGSGCDSTSSQNELEGGILATFDVVGERFRIWVTNPQTIDQILALERGESSATIPNGPLLRGPGENDHNAPWSWHLDPGKVQMAEITIELCSGLPSFVEENLDEWVDVVGQYCPWSASLERVQDFR